MSDIRLLHARTRQRIPVPDGLVALPGDLCTFATLVDNACMLVPCDFRQRWDHTQARTVKVPELALLIHLDFFPKQAYRTFVTVLVDGRIMRFMSLVPIVIHWKSLVAA